MTWLPERSVIDHVLLPDSQGKLGPETSREMMVMKELLVDGDVKLVHLVMVTITGRRTG